MRRYIIMPMDLPGYREYTAEAALLVKEKAYSSVAGAAAAWFRACQSARPPAHSLTLLPCHFIAVEVPE